MFRKMTCTVFLYKYHNKSGESHQQLDKNIVADIRKQTYYTNSNTLHFLLNKPTLTELSRSGTVAANHCHTLVIDSCYGELEIVRVIIIIIIINRV